MKINAARGGSRRLLASPQRMHAAVLSGFPDHSEGDRVLWRLDQASRHDLNLLIVSPTAPDLTHLIEQAGWPTRSDATWETHSYDSFLARLAAGQAWAFRLRANPVVRRRDSTGRTKTIPLTLRGQRDWLLGRAGSLGVRFAEDDEGFPSFQVADRKAESFTRANAERGRQVSIVTAQFDGMLEVADAERLRRALTDGVGRAKAYGCGLLTLARLG